MTIRLENLTIDFDYAAWALDMTRNGRGGIDITNDETRRFDILAMVRHIMRDRSDCTMIPVVRAVVMFPTNEWGHNCEIEVTYAHKGYRAIYGAHLGDNGVGKFSCYMD